MYEPHGVACITVTVTESDTCPIPTVTYLDIPEITFVGNIAHCRVRLNTQDGNPAIEGTPSVWGYDGVAYVDLGDQILPIADQTVELIWEMQTSTPYCRCCATIKNSCGKLSVPYRDDVATCTAIDYEYSEEEGNIVVTSFIVTPLSCKDPCDVDISISWTNVGTASQMFEMAYTVDGAKKSLGTTTLLAGATVTKVATEYGLGVGDYKFCPEPNP